MTPLKHNADGTVEPGGDESWEELAEHSLTHDDLPAPVRLHWHLAMGEAVAPRVRLSDEVTFRAGGPLRLHLKPCTARLLGGRWAGKCEARGRAFGWWPGAPEDSPRQIYLYSSQESG